jgi:hypothetical protein
MASTKESSLQCLKLYKTLALIGSNVFLCNKFPMTSWFVEAEQRAVHALACQGTIEEKVERERVCV